MNNNTNPSASTQTTYSFQQQEHDLDGTRERTWYLVNRAYQNIYGMSVPSDLPYQQTIFNAAIHLLRDQRTRHLNDKYLLQAFEDIIRISDEHHRQAQKHLSRASNAVYLRETALDNILEHQKYVSALEELMPQNTVRSRAEYTGRVEREAVVVSHRDVMDIGAEQLSITLNIQGK